LHIIAENNPAEDSPRPYIRPATNLLPGIDVVLKVVIQMLCHKKIAKMHIRISVFF
jgi:hypothetical protein